MKKLFTMLATAALLCVVGCDDNLSNEPGSGNGGGNQVPPENNVIEFEDGTVMRICIDNWDTNNDEKLSYDEARSIKSLGGKFRRTNITSFNEFQYFTGIESIAYYEFEECESLKNIIIPNGVKTIGGFAFESCRNLKSISIPGSVKTIEEDAFDYCTSLADITISDGVETIGESAFCECSMTSITIPGSVKTIGQGAFAGCKNLTDITIGDGVTEIGDYAFEYCRNLTSFYCKPTTPPALGEYTFYIFNSNYNDDEISPDLKIYVPKASVEAYKNKWSDYASKIVGYDF